MLEACLPHKIDGLAILPKAKEVENTFTIVTQVKIATLHITKKVGTSVDVEMGEHSLQEKVALNL